VQEYRLEEGRTMQVVGVVPNNTELLDFLKECKADILLLGINESTARGIETLKKMQKAKMNVKTIVLTMHNHLSLEQQYIMHGAYTCLYKMTDIDTLLQAIQKVVDGSVTTIGKVSKQKYTTKFLTEREIEIVKWVKAGLSTKLIADLLNISQNTVRNHRKNIMEKTGGKNMTEASSKVLVSG